MSGQPSTEVDEIRYSVEALAGFGHRGSATSHEARAAEWVASRLDGMGVRAEVQPFRGRGSWATSYILHVMLAAVGACLLPLAPQISALLAVTVILSLIGEHTTKWPSLRALLGSSPSQNVFAKLPVEGTPTSRILLVAHVDSQRTGLIFNDASQRLLFKAAGLPVWLRNMFLPVILALVLQAAGGMFLSLGGEPRLAVPLAGLLLCIYGVTLALVIDWRRSPYVPGALDNASGVAAVLALARRFVDRPIPGIEPWVLFTGCEETGLLGATAWADGNRSEPANLTFINLDCVGVGPLRFFARENPVVGPSVPYPPDLVLRAQRVGSAFASPPEPTVLPGPTDGLPFLVRGFRGITLFGLTTDGRMPNYHRMTDTPENVDYAAVEQAVDFAWAFARESLSPVT